MAGEGGPPEQPEQPEHEMGVSGSLDKREAGHTGAGSVVRGLCKRVGICSQCQGGC